MSSPVSSALLFAIIVRKYELPQVADLSPIVYLPLGTTRDEKIDIRYFYSSPKS